MSKKLNYISKHILISPDIYRLMTKEAESTTGGNSNLLIREILEQYYAKKKK